MKKIVIFGNSGSGKSTLARKLCAEHGLAHLDLDTLAWESGSPPTRRELVESHRETDAFIDRHPQWAIEGCYSDLIEPLLERANELIFLDLPIDLCIANAKARPWEAHKYDSKAAQDANLAALLDWIAQYEERTDTFSRSAHIAMYDKYLGKKIRYTSNGGSA
ncbi:MAG: AAA family ATPase [Pseudomonadota bacterium]